MNKQFVFWTIFIVAAVAVGALIYQANRSLEEIPANGAPGWIKNTPDKPGNGQTNSPAEMAEAEARIIAQNSCVKGGETLGTGIYNENSKTWWFDANLNATNPGCNPACVVSAQTKTAEINWRCTGAIPPAGSNGAGTSTACTMEAKICPDGSAVGRSGPDCEFTACPAANSGQILCTPESRMGDVCAQIYDPVCATVNIQCIKAPCNPIKQTFGNACEACHNPLVESYDPGECQ